jgi:hypothetical protein
LVAAATFALVALPLASYFFLHPADLSERVQNAAATSDQTLIGGVVGSLDGLFVTGDPNYRQDLPGRPLVDPPVAVALVIGIVLGVTRWRDPATSFAVAWCVAMLAPAALFYEPAHALRLAGLLPFVFLPPSRAIDAVARFKVPIERAAGAVVAALLIVGGGFASARDYFLVWPRLNQTIDFFGGDLMASLALVNQVPPASAVFATSQVYEGQAIPVSLVERVASRVRAYDANQVFVVPANPTEPVSYIAARSQQPPGGLATIASLAQIGDARDAIGRLEGNLFRLDPPFADKQPEHPPDGSIGSAVDVTGFDYPPFVVPGLKTSIALHWTVQQPLGPGTWELFADSLQPGRRDRLSEVYNDSFPANQWRTGDRVISWFNLWVPNDVASDDIDVAFGLTDVTTGRRVLAAPRSGQSDGNTLLAGPLRISRPDSSLSPQHPLVAKFGSSITLRGYDVHRQDKSVAVTLYWRADEPIDENYTVFVHVLDSTGNRVAGTDSQPHGGVNPTSSWTPGHTYADEHVVPGAGSTAASGRIEIGKYLLSTGQRLPIADAQGQPEGDALQLPP